MTAEKAVIKAADQWAKAMEDIADAEDRKDRDREILDELDGELGDAEIALLNAVQQWRQERRNKRSLSPLLS
jgi:hypothetical protein